MATVTPDSIWGIYKLIRPFFKTSQIQGGVANDSNNSGYHVSRETLLAEGRTGDYSVRVAEDKLGAARNASGIDITLNDAEMKLVHGRLLAAFRSDDPRVAVLREVYGTVDGRNVTGWNTRLTGRPIGYLGPGASDPTHIWHEHLGILRKWSGDPNAAKGVAEVIAGQPAGTFGWSKDGVVLPPPVVLPHYFVTSLQLWGIDHETGKAVKDRKWGYEITIPDRIIDLEGRKWLLTSAGYRYDMKFLSTVKPTVPPPDPEPLPPPTDASEALLTINTRKSNIPDKAAYKWANRRAACVAAIKSTDATLIGAQECRPDQRIQLGNDLGMRYFHRGNIVLFYNPAVWEISAARGYDLKFGEDDRWLIAATFTHKVTGKVIRVGNTHLTNLEPPTDGPDDWRIGQTREIIKLEKKLDVLFGDFNSSKLVYDLTKSLAELEDLRRKAPADRITNRAKNTTHHYRAGGTANDGRWIDNVLTSVRVKVLSGSVLLLDAKSTFKNASDHNGVVGRISV